MYVDVCVLFAHGSACGKVIELWVGPDRSVAVVQLRCGLLDTGRVHGQGHPGSRNFNIFYQLCAGTPHDPDSLLQIKVFGYCVCVAVLWPAVRWLARPSISRLWCTLRRTLRRVDLISVDGSTLRHPIGHATPVCWRADCPMPCAPLPPSQTHSHVHSHAHAHSVAHVQTHACACTCVGPLSVQGAEAFASLHPVGAGPDVGAGQFHNWSDSSAFAKTKDALQGLGIGAEEQAAVFKVLAAILHLGNLQFEGTARSLGSHVWVFSSSQRDLNV